MSFPVMAALDVFTEESVIPHLGGSTNEAQEGVAIEIAQAVLGALLEKAVNAFMVAPEDESVSVTPHLGGSTKEAREGLAIEIAEAVLGTLLEEAVIDIYL
ncbi:hypothetical protein RIF29_25489 [Crotalaria pallida]|uniref:Uncharacterized protein n=1 Tax=Crotalaria pallida TaxID=3830 RepID=A0AAN9ELP6_CROPI